MTKENVVTIDFAVNVICESNEQAQQLMMDLMDGKVPVDRLEWFKSNATVTKVRVSKDNKKVKE